MKAFFLFLAGGLVLTAFTAGTCRAHGVDGYVQSTSGYCITAMYDDGEPMSYAAVEITAPDSKIQFQTGRTDRNGCFMVRPDLPGPWQAVVKDAMGHRLALDMEVAAETETPDKADPQPVKAAGGMTRPVQIVVGLSVITGLCGFLYGWRARRAAVPPGRI